MPHPDPMRAAFVASSDGHAIVHEEDWRRFTETLRSDGLLTSDREHRILDDFWRSHAADSYELRKSRMTYSALRHHLSKALSTQTEATDMVYTSLKMLRAGMAQLQALTQIDQPDPRVLMALLTRCAKADATLKLCETDLAHFIKRATSDLDVEPVLKLTHSTLGDKAHMSCVDPYQWQLEHVLDIERHASNRRVISLSHIRYTKRDCIEKDPRECGVRLRFVHAIVARLGYAVSRRWHLAQGLVSKCEGLTVREAQVVCADGKERNAYVVELQPPRRSNRFCGIAHGKALLWQAYAACRGLAAAPSSVPHALGWFDDHPGDEARRGVTTTSAPPFGTRFVYERPSARPLLVELARAQARRGALTPSAPLVRHWVREVLARAAEIDTMSTHELLGDMPFGPRNLWIGEHGAAIRVGGLRWGVEIPEAHRGDRLRHRSYKLLAGFADAAEEIIFSLCDGESPVESKATKVFRDLDNLAGIFVDPSERFELVLTSPADPTLQWRYPQLTDRQKEVVQFIDSPTEINSPLHIDTVNRHARLRLLALRPGFIEVVLRCSSDRRSSVDYVSAMTSLSKTKNTLPVRIWVSSNRVEGPLRGILRCCRLLAVDSSSGTSSFDFKNDEHSCDDRTAALTPSMLMSHDYFTSLSQDNLGHARSEYERLFCLNDSVDSEVAAAK